MQDLIEEMIAGMIDEPIKVELDDKLDALGETITNSNGFIIRINVLLHNSFGDRALDELRDTIRHEVAHVAHIASLMPRILHIAATKYQENLEAATRLHFDPLHYDFFFQGAIRTLKHHEHSHHGPAWRRFARKYGATPRS